MKDNKKIIYYFIFHLILGLSLILMALYFELIQPHNGWNTTDFVSSILAIVGIKLLPFGQYRA